MKRARVGRRVSVFVVEAMLAACVPVTVNVTFSQQKLDDAASQTDRGEWVKK